MTTLCDLDVYKRQGRYVCGQQQRQLPFRASAVWRVQRHRYRQRGYDAHLVRGDAGKDHRAEKRFGRLNECFRSRTERYDGTL